jgi:hypothetical protein
MKIELRKVTKNERMSEETYCFSADVWIDGAKAGEVSNRGCDGPNDYHPTSLWQRLEEHAKTLPPVVSKYTDDTFPSTADIVIGDLLELELARKDAKRAMSGKILFTKVGKAGIWGMKKPAGCTDDTIRTFAAKAKGIDRVLNLLPLDEAVALCRSAA